MTKNKLVSTNLDTEYFPMLAAYAKAKGLTLSSALRLIVIEKFDNDDPQKQKDALKEFFQSKI